MSLTGPYHAFASIDQDGVNKVALAFFGARPRYLHYGTPHFVASTTVHQTQIPAIAFPGIPGGINFKVDLSVPRVQLYPASGPLPSPLTLGADQLAIETIARITVGCMQPGPVREKLPTLTPIFTELEVWAIGQPVTQTFSPGDGEISFVVDTVEVVDIAPPSLDAVLDCVLRMILNAVLSNLQLPFSILNVDFFKLILEQGPVIEAHQIELRGDVV